MIKNLMHNWGWRLLSLLLAVVLWAMIISYDDPLVPVSFEGVPVTIINEEAITSQDIAIEYLDGMTVDVTLEGNRSTMEKLSSEDITAYADLSRVSITNAIDIEIEVDDTIDVLSKEPSEMLIATEQIKSVLKSVQVRYRGELEEDYIKLTAVVTPNQIEITGPESKIAMVASVVVPIDLDQVNDDVIVSAEPELLDSDSNEIRDLEVNNAQIQVKVPIQKIKTVPVTIATVGEVSDDYRLMDLNLGTTAVVIRGEEADIENISKLVVSDVNLSVMTDATTSLQINLANYLPDGVDLYEQEALTMLEVDIEPIITKNYVIEQGDINVTQIPDDLQFGFLEEETYTISVSGIEDELYDLSIEDMLPRVALSDLEMGVHEVPLDLTIPTGFQLSSSIPTVMVELIMLPDGPPPLQGEGEGVLPLGEVTDLPEDGADESLTEGDDDGNTD